MFKKVQKSNQLEEEEYNSEEEESAAVEKPTIIVTPLDLENKKESSKNKFNLDFKENVIYIKDDSNNAISLMNLFINPIDSINDIVRADDVFIKFLDEKINTFSDSHFKNYLLDLFVVIKNDFNDYTYLNKLNEFELSLNYLFDLIICYDNINNLNNFDFISVYTINDKIINNKFNYLNNNYINLNNINLLFKSISEKEKEKD
jgi:hypothetical protein